MSVASGAVRAGRHPDLGIIRDEMARLETKLRDMSDVPYPPLADVLTHLVSAGGKRLRPAVALLVSKVYACDTERALSLAAGLEMLHTATLVHDDLIDQAVLRRGMPTLNTVWTPVATILAGDYMFGRAARYVAETENPRVITLFAEALKTIVGGELQQLYNRPVGLPTQDAYFQRIYGKTAALFTTAAEAAGELGAAPPQIVAQLHDYGYNLGMAFQIIDDILDFTGAQAEVGKPVGGDLREGIVTLPVMLYAQDEPDSPFLRRYFAAGVGADRREAVDALVAAVRQSPAVEAARSVAADFVARANTALAALPDVPARRVLEDIGAYTVVRHE
ncbi:MAG: polyprenyl synthetase family protein [Anaerolineae bacterium]